MSIDENIRLAIEVLTALGVVFAWGRFTGRIEVAVKRVEKLEAHLERIPAIEQHMEFLDERFRRIESHHRQLAESTAEMRGKFASTHDE